MRICWRVAAITLISASIASGASLADQAERLEPEIDMFVTMAGKCSTLKVVESDFTLQHGGFFP